MEDKLSEKIYVDEEIEKIIAFTLRQYKLIAFIWILVSILSTIISLMRIIHYYNYNFADWMKSFAFKTESYLYLLIVFINLILLFYYYNGIRYQKKAIDESNQSYFVKSFRYYRNGNYASIAVLTLNLVTYIILLFQEM